MEKYSLSFKKSVAKDFRAIPKQDIKRLIQCLESLQKNPRAAGCLKLAGSECYRVRQGNYRIVYEIQDQQLVVLVIKVAHRRDVYR